MRAFLEETIQRGFWVQVTFLDLVLAPRVGLFCSGKQKGKERKQNCALRTPVLWALANLVKNPQNLKS